MDALKPFLTTISSGMTLSAAEATQAFETILAGEATPAQIGAFLMALRVRGETVEEIAGAQVMRRHALAVKAPDHALDTWHGRRRHRTIIFPPPRRWWLRRVACMLPSMATAPCRQTPARLRCWSIWACALISALPRSKTAFAKPYRFHVRTQSSRRHAPCRAGASGTWHQNRVQSAGALVEPAGPAGNYSASSPTVGWSHAHGKHLGSERAWVVHGADGMDELTTTGPSKVAELRKNEVEVFEVNPEDAGLKRSEPSDLVGGTPEENAAALNELLDGAHSAYRDIVLLNAAAGSIYMQ